MSVFQDFRQTLSRRNPNVWNWLWSKSWQSGCGSAGWLQSDSAGREGTEEPHGQDSEKQLKIHEGLFLSFISTLLNWYCFHGVFRPGVTGIKWKKYFFSQQMWAFLFERETFSFSAQLLACVEELIIILLSGCVGSTGGIAYYAHNVHLAAASSFSLHKLFCVFSEPEDGGSFLFPQPLVNWATCYNWAIHRNKKADMAPWVLIHL